MTRQPLTEGGLTLHNRATVTVPPSRSMTFESSMPAIIGMPNPLSIGLPIAPSLRLAYMSEWGKRIERRMAELGVSQTELAAACGIKPPSVNGWVSGKSKMIDGQNLVLAARKLNTSPEWIMTGRGVAEQSHEAGWDLSMLSEALVSLDKAVRKKGLRYDAAYVAPALRIAYLERLKHPAKLDRAAYAIYDSMVQQQLEVQQGEYERGHGGTAETSAGGAGKAKAHRQKTRASK